MTSSTNTSRSIGGIGMSGERAVECLLARVMSFRIAEVGGECGEGDILKAILNYDWRSGPGSKRVSSSVTLHMGDRTDNGLRPIVASVGRDWKVFLHFESSDEGGTITTLLSDARDGRQAWVHDPPGGEAAKTVVATGLNPAMPGVSYGYVRQETHYAHGLIWDPGESQAADTCHFDDGSVKWRRRYQGGRMMGRGDSVPSHESYWPGGVLQLEEYGSANVGRHRNPDLGPAYAEYYPTGQKALEVFADKNENGIVCILGGGGWDQAGRPRALSDQEARTLSCTSLAMVNCSDIDGFFEARMAGREACDQEQKARQGQPPNQSVVSGLARAGRGVPKSKPGRTVQAPTARRVFPKVAEGGRGR